MKLFLKSHFILIVVVLCAFAIRFFALTSIPVGIHGDEASIGYNAYSLLKTVRDQEGNFLPIAIDQFGDFRPAGYHYLTMPFVLILGLSDLAVRLPSALFGALTILIFYFFLSELFTSKRIALIGAFLLAFSPWHIVISRATSEGVVAGFFIVLGSFFLLKGLKSKANKVFFTASFISFCISFFFYHSARFFVPPFVLFLLAAFYLQFKPSKKQMLFASGVFGLLLICLFAIFVAGKGTSRPLNVSIFNIPGGAVNLKQQMDEDGTQNPLITRFLHNKLFFYGRLFGTSYFEHLSGNFLFIENGLPARYRVPWFGNMYPIEGLFLLFGFAVLVSEGLKSKKWLYLLPVIWFLLGAVPAGLTWEDVPNIQRSSLMLFGLLAVTAFGINESLLILNKKIKTIVILIIIAIFTQNILSFFHNYFYHSRIHEPWHRSAAQKELNFQVNELSKQYKSIVMTTENNNNLIFYLYYNKFDPKMFQQLGSPREQDGLRFQNLVYTHNPCPLEGEKDSISTGHVGTVFINKSGCRLPGNVEIINVVRLPDGIPAFEIVKTNEELQ